MLPSSLLIFLLLVKSVDLTKECMFVTVAFLIEDDDISFKLYSTKEYNKLELLLKIIFCCCQTQIGPQPFQNDNLTIQVKIAIKCNAQ